MSETTEYIQSNESERSKVEGWRLHVLMEAGYPLSLAERIAGERGRSAPRGRARPVQGCTPETAAEILL